MQQRATRFWNGARRDLAALGITPTISYAGAYFGNTSNAPTEGSYGGGLHASVNVDFGKLAGLRGLSAYLDVWWMQASSADAIFNTSLFPSNDNFVGNGLWVGQLYVQQAFAQGDLSVAAGRLGPGATFATLPSTYSQALELSYQYTISAAINVVVDAQYLFRLNGYPSRGTTVLGTQLAVTF